MKPGDGQEYSDGVNTWDVARLIEAAIRLVPYDMDVSSFVELDGVRWSAEAMTVREIAEHARRIYEANLDYPIILSAEGHVMDGCHRLAKAFLEGRKIIAVVRFEVTPPPDEPENPETR